MVALSIGSFSLVTGLSITALRHYETASGRLHLRGSTPRLVSAIPVRPGF